MAHELSFINGVAEFAFLEGTPVWHGHGQPVPAEMSRSIDYWGQASNLANWQVMSTPMLGYDSISGEIITMETRKMLYRSDTRMPLADVGANFKEVQPMKLIETFRRCFDELGYHMLTCGALFGGRKIWAQASIGEPTYILGQERVDGKLLAATANDGTMKTRFQYTQTAVVCNNTLRMATSTDAESVEVSHALEWTPDQIHEMLELNTKDRVEWLRLAEQMASIHILPKEAQALFDFCFNGPMKADELKLIEEAQASEDTAALAAAADRGNSKAIDTCTDLFLGEGLGMNLDCRRLTLWGAVNAVTEFIDHHRQCKTMDARIDRAWFGDGATIKNRAWEEAGRLFDLAA